MKTYSFLILALLLSILCFCKVTIAQIDQKYPGETDPKKAYVQNYLKSFDRFVNNPDSFFVNGQRMQEYFESKTGSKIYNFLSPKRIGKGAVSPLDLYNEVITNYPDGFGMAYSLDQLEFMGRKKDFFKPIYAYKLPVEFSGIRKDGSLLSYADEQYLYISTATGKSTQIESKLLAVKNKSYHQGGFKRKQYRQGLFVEPFLNFNYSDGDFYFYDDKGWGEDGLYYRTDYGLGGKFQNYYGINIVNMFTPNIGLGLGASNYKTNPRFNFFTSEYRLDEIFGYIPIVSTRIFHSTYYVNSYLKHSINVSAFSVPIFARLQFGGSIVSFSIDAGMGIIFKPYYESYLDGTIKYFGESVATGEIVTSHPTLGFGTYSYNNELVHQHQDSNNKTYMFGRFNLHLQPSKYFYIRATTFYNTKWELDYNEQWHMFDIYALRLPNANDKKDIYSYGFEFSVGFHIEELILK